MMGNKQSKPICPDYDKLVDSFTRWERETCRTNAIAFAPPLLLGIDLDSFAARQNFPPPPPLIKILSNLPTVRLHEMSEEDRSCNICLERFKYAHEVRRDESQERPIRLPCGHVFGDMCFQEWHYPFGKALSCPICRAENLPHHAQQTAPEGVDPILHFETRMDEIVWTDSVSAKRKSQEERALYRQNRYTIAMKRVQLANREWMAFKPGTRKQLKAWKQRRLEIDDMAGMLERSSWDYQKDVCLAARIHSVCWDPQTEGEILVENYIGELPRTEAALAF